MQQPWKGLKEGLGGGPRGISVEWGRHEPRVQWLTKVFDRFVVNNRIVRGKDIRDFWKFSGRLKFQPNDSNFFGTDLSLRFYKYFLERCSPRDRGYFFRERERER